MLGWVFSKQLKHSSSSSYEMDHTSHRLQGALPDLKCPPNHINGFNPTNNLTLNEQTLLSACSTLKLIRIDCVISEVRQNLTSTPLPLKHAHLMILLGSDFLRLLIRVLSS